MKKLLLTFAAAALLASCSQEEGLDGGASKNSGVTVAIQGYQMEGGISTRTSVSFDMTGNPPFTYKWTEGDRIGLFPEGEEMQQIFLDMAGEMGDRMKFTGKGFSVNGGTNYAIYYPFIYDYDLKSNNITLNYGTQTQEGNGSCTHLTAHDYMAAVATASSDHNVDFNLTHVGTILVITGQLPEAGSYSSMDITAPGEDFATTAKLSLFPQPVVTPAQKTSTISLNLQNVSTTEDNRTFTAFMQICPADLNGKALTITLHPADGGKGLTYHHTPAKAWEGNKAYLIKLEEDEVNHDKNPLLKWAETNLVYNKNTGKSEFATTYTAGGSLYQWGRNYGWADYQDAMGTYNEAGHYYEYAITNGKPNTHPGVGIFTQGSSVGQISMYEDYDSNDVRAHTNMYFMNAGWSGSEPILNADYWIWNNGGNTWYERANACGYSTTNPCPEGWRLPTLADFKEIYPTGGVSSTSNLSTALTNTVELREIPEECKYAIRWIKEGDALKIQALVVPDDFTTEKLSNINWEDNNVVTRYFPFTGRIEGHSDRAYMLGGYDYVSRPMPLGTWIRKTHRYYEFEPYATIMQLELTNIVDKGTKCFGGYWVSDQKGIFRIIDNEEMSSLPTGVNLVYTAAQNAYAIRPIRN